MGKMMNQALPDCASKQVAGGSTQIVGITPLRYSICLLQFTDAALCRQHGRAVHRDIAAALAAQGMVGGQGFQMMAVFMAALHAGDDDGGVVMLVQVDIETR